MFKSVCIAGLVTVLALSAAGAAQQQQPATQPETRPATAAIDKAVRQLGDDDYRTRVEAQRKVVEIGQPAREALEKASASSDPEVVKRAKDALILIERNKVEAASLAARKRVLWSTALNEGVAGSPVVCGKTIAVRVGAGMLVGMDSKGKQKWQWEPNTPLTHLAGGEGALLAWGNSGLSCLDEDGKARWSVDLDSAGGPKGVLAAGELVLVWDVRGKIQAFAIKGGARKWEASAQGGIAGQCVVLGETFYTISAGGKVSRFELKGGRLGEISDLGGSRPGDLYAAGQTLLLERDGKLTAYDDKDSKLKQVWAAELTSSDAGEQLRQLRMEVDGKWLPVPSSEPMATVSLTETSFLAFRGGKLFAFDFNDGKSRSFELPAEKEDDADGQRVINLNGRDIIIQGGGGLVAANGLVFTSGGGWPTLLAVAGEQAFVSRGRELIALEIDGGKVLWKLPLTTPLSGRPVVVGDTMYFGTAKAPQVPRSLDGQGKKDAKDSNNDKLTLSVGLHAMKISR